MEFFIATGMMLSPRVFMSLGNATGLLGGWVFAWIVALCIWGIVCWRSRQVSVSALNSDVLSESVFFLRSANVVKVAFYTTALIRLLLLCFLTTSVLALAGFSFNEVFFYQFPNMGFTFVLLSVLCGTHLFDEKLPRILQCVFCLGAILGFGIISVSGLINSPELSASLPQWELFSLDEVLLLLAPALLIFVGFELAGVVAQDNSSSKIPWQLVSLLFMAFLFILFVHVARLYVPMEKLANSSVPHMIVGRKILGETGRYLAGGAVIFGSAAAVNALLLAWRSTLQKSIANKTQPKLGSRIIERGLAGVVPFALVSLLLWGGYAGEPVLETWLGITFSLYLLIYVGRGVSSLSRRPLTGISAIVVSSMIAMLTFYSAIYGHA